jgi:hypothetical protein
MQQRRKEGADDEKYHSGDDRHVIAGDRETPQSS